MEGSDYKKNCQIRDAVIEYIIPDYEVEEFHKLMNGVSIALIASSNEKPIKMSREGFVTVETYIRYLEREVFNLLNLEPIDLVAEVMYNKIPCRICNGIKYVAKTVKKKRTQVKCERCNATGIETIKEDNNG